MNWSGDRDQFQLHRQQEHKGVREETQELQFQNFFMCKKMTECYEDQQIGNAWQFTMKDVTDLRALWVPHFVLGTIVINEPAKQ